MKGRSQDQWLHDYLDGRLSAEERAQAEARIRKDAELARRVETLRKIGTALREDSAELPPGFYTRARARFEQSLAPRPRFSHRLFSWEAVSVGAVAVLAVALFVPGLMRDRSPEPADRPTRIAEGERREDVADAPARTEAETGRSVREELAPAPPESRPAPAREIEEGFAAQPMAKVVPRAPADAGVHRSRASSALGPTVSAVALPKQVLLPDGIQVIDDRSTWDAWLAGPAGPVLSRLGSYEPGRRLVLLGRPNGIDCSTVTVSRLHDEYRVAFDHDGGPAGGCAFVLSGADGARVGVED